MYTAVARLFHTTQPQMMCCTVSALLFQLYCLDKILIFQHLFHVRIFWEHQLQLLTSLHDHCPCTAAVCRSFVNRPSQVSAILAVRSERHTVPVDAVVRRHPVLLYAIPVLIVIGVPSDTRTRTPSICFIPGYCANPYVFITHSDGGQGAFGYWICPVGDGSAGYLQPVWMTVM
ncbi:uncharacterized protein LOC119338196 [Triticum dicoccoides]|uniref:uncharacterized protein LOC119338196 n=1 Tax=Triticum dicoccoides TaxID=85692 RepID=UPI001891172F|nr:uncharacterized protein LOC119338196 [Triticum dicoccoides]